MPRDWHGEDMTSIRRPSNQPQPEWTCVCGRTVRGNGGQSSHKRACRPWMEHKLAENEKVLTGIADGTWGNKARPGLVEQFRQQAEHNRDNLRQRLGLTVSEDEHDLPGH